MSIQQNKLTIVHENEKIMSNFPVTSIYFLPLFSSYTPALLPFSMPWHIILSLRLWAFKVLEENKTNKQTNKNMSTFSCFLWKMFTSNQTFLTRETRVVNLFYVTFVDNVLKTCKPILEIGTVCLQLGTIQDKRMDGRMSDYSVQGGSRRKCHAISQVLSYYIRRQVISKVQTHNRDQIPGSLLK